MANLLKLTFGSALTVEQLSSLSTESLYVPSRSIQCNIAHLFIKLFSFFLNYVLLIFTQTDVISIGVNNTNLGVVVSTYFFYLNLWFVFIMS